MKKQKGCRYERELRRDAKFRERQRTKNKGASLSHYAKLNAAADSVVDDFISKVEEFCE